MTKHILRLGFATLMGAATACYAQAGSSAPSGATGQCKDGTYTTATTKSGACSGHQGLKAWYSTANSGSKSSSKDVSKSDDVVNPHSNATMSDQRAKAINKKSGNEVVATPNDDGKTVAGPAANGSANTGASTAAAGSASANGSASGSSSHSHNTAKGSSSTSVAGKAAAPGGGPDRVWLNSDTKVYHCYGTQWYGKTKNGKYVSEQEAVSAGAKPDHGKACSSGQ
jgi:hypothetical protein